MYKQCKVGAEYIVVRSADGQEVKIRDNLAIFATTAMEDDVDFDDIKENSEVLIVQ